MNNRLFYIEQSHLSALGRHQSHLSHLSQQPSDLFVLTQNLFVHENECQWGNYEFAKARYVESYYRRVEDMLSQIFTLSSRPLHEPRSLEEKLIVSCRGAALLFCAFLRNQGIPGRLRVGFVSYHPIARFKMDHVVTEYWEDGKWKCADPLMSEAFFKMNPKAKNLNPLDLSEEAFIPAEQAWINLRTKKEDCSQYGVGLFQNRRGLFSVRNKLLHALAARLKFEMLPGDLWGYMLFDGPSVDPTEESQLQYLDELASLLLQDDFAQLKAFYEAHAAVKVPSIVLNHNPLKGVVASEWEVQSCL